LHAALSVVQSLSFQHDALKESDSSIADLQNRLEEVSAAKRESDEGLAKLQAIMDRELAQLQGELEGKILRVGAERF